MSDDPGGLTFVPHGLPSNLSWQRSWSYSSDQERLHSLGLRHEGPDGVLVLVTHLPKRGDIYDQRGRLSMPAPTLDDAGHVALVGYVSAEPPGRRTEDEQRAWIRSLLVEQGIFHGDRSAWHERTVLVGGGDREALVREMPEGFCLVTEIEGALLSINTRGVEPAGIELVPRHGWLSEYDGPPSTAPGFERYWDPRNHVQ